jgi:transcriptional regulator with XRE-family HTH domain
MLGMAKPSPSDAGSPVLKSLGKTIWQIRLKKGYSQESVALASEIDHSYFGGIEGGEHNITLINIEKIAKALGVSLKDLFTK